MILKIAISLLGDKEIQKLKINSLIRKLITVSYLISKIWTKSLKIKYQLQTEFTR
jgi:hypothetical protein